MSKLKQGIVVSNKMDKTAVVQIDRMVPHVKYSKRYRVSKRFIVHDATNAAQIGHKVTIRETKPISKRKHWEMITPDSDAAAETAPAKEEGTA